MGIPTNPNQPLSTFQDDGEIKPPIIEWIHNNPSTTTHLPLPDSSWLQSISYDSQSLRMTITTKDGKSWQHGQVYPNQFAEMQIHPSKGSYYSKNIKGKHPTTDIIKRPKLGNFPKETNDALKPKDRFKYPLTERYTAGRQPRTPRYG